MKKNVYDMIDFVDVHCFTLTYHTIRKLPLAAVAYVSFHSFSYNNVFCSTDK